MYIYIYILLYIYIYIYYYILYILYIYTYIYYTYHIVLYYIYASWVLFRLEKQKAENSREAEQQRSKEAEKQRSRKRKKSRKAKKQGKQINKKNAQNGKKIAFLLPSGKHTKNYGKSPCYSWENPLFLWPFSMAVFSTLSVGQDTSGWANSLDWDGTSFPAAWIWIYTQYVWWCEEQI